MFTNANEYNMFVSSDAGEICIQFKPYGRQPVDRRADKKLSEEIIKQLHFLLKIKEYREIGTLTFEDLLDTCRASQDEYKKLLEYFEVG